MTKFHNGAEGIDFHTSFCYNIDKQLFCLFQLEKWFETTLKEKKGFIIKKMGEDGACLFRSVGGLHLFSYMDKDLLICSSYQFTTCHKQ